MADATITVVDGDGASTEETGRAAGGERTSAGIGAGWLSLQRSENSSCFSDFLQTFHKRLILLGFLHVIFGLQTYPDGGIRSKGSLQQQGIFSCNRTLAIDYLVEYGI